MISAGTCVKVVAGGPGGQGPKELRAITGGTHGDQIVGIVKELGKRVISGEKGSGSQWKKGDLVRALIVRTVKGAQRSSLASGIRLSFPKENAVIILGSLAGPKRLTGPVQGVVRAKGPLAASAALKLTGGVAATHTIGTLV